MGRFSTSGCRACTTIRPYSSLPADGVRLPWIMQQSLWRFLTILVRMTETSEGRSERHWVPCETALTSGSRATIHSALALDAAAVILAV
jgi:hypothetical protein